MRQTGKLYIDDIDAMLEYGVFVERYGYKALIQMPSFKKLDSTDWSEYNGEEVDLIAPKLDTRSLLISFCITDVRYAENLFNYLSNGAYHTFYFTELKKTYKLRMTSNGSFSSKVKLGKFTLSFNDDFPKVPSETYYQEGESGIIQRGYEVDNVDFSQFGTFVLDGSDDSIRKSANTKTNLTININNLSGVIYDSEEVKLKTKEVTLKLLIDADGIDEFWKRWNSLFSVIMQPESRIFYFAALESEYECYYKSNTVSKFDILRSDKVWCEFSVVLVFTSYRSDNFYMLLATEDGDWIITEDSENPSYIKIKPKNN